MHDNTCTSGFVQRAGDLNRSRQARHRGNRRVLSPLLGEVGLRPSRQCCSSTTGVQQETNQPFYFWYSVTPLHHCLLDLPANWNIASRSCKARSVPYAFWYSLPTIRYGTPLTAVPCGPANHSEGAMARSSQKIIQPKQLGPRHAQRRSSMTATDLSEKQAATYFPVRSQHTCAAKEPHLPLLQVGLG